MNKKLKYLFTTLAALVFLALLVAVVSGCFGSKGNLFGVSNDNMSIYRGVNASSNGNANLSPGQFRFNNDLSTFNQASQNHPCNYSFTVTGVPNNPAQVNDEGNVSGLIGYRAKFDNNPQGHWSVIKPANVTADQAKQAVSDYAKTHRGNVVNGSQNNCH
jgi:hypothetical protein